MLLLSQFKFSPQMGEADEQLWETIQLTNKHFVLF